MEEQPETSARFPEHCRLLSDPAEVEKGGWREALISAGDHLKRVIDEYGDLDFECLLEEVDPASLEGCTDCFNPRERVYRLYVRSR
jgi:hypothetical protein